MADEFKAGDVVQLNPGGPLMTLISIGGNGHALCSWFAGNDLKNEAIPMVALDKPKTLGQTLGVEPVPSSMLPRGV